jgi:hypothetical protein
VNAMRIGRTLQKMQPVEYAKGEIIHGCCKAVQPKADRPMANAEPWIVKATVRVNCV